MRIRSSYPGQQRLGRWAGGLREAPCQSAAGANAAKALNPPLNLEGRIRYHLAFVVVQGYAIGSPDRGRRGFRGTKTSVGAVRRVSVLPCALAPRNSGAEFGGRLT